jgi:hypothetical protein
MRLLDDTHAHPLEPANILPSPYLGIFDDRSLVRSRQHFHVSVPVFKTAIMSRLASYHSKTAQDETGLGPSKDNKLHPPKTSGDKLHAPQQWLHQNSALGAALTDTPSSTAPNSPKM